MAVRSKKLISLFLVLLISLGNLPVLHADEDDEVQLVNLLAADMDTHFDSGVSPFTQDASTSGGAQQIVQVNGNNALEIRDASLGTNAASSFYYQLNSGSLKDRINAIYNMPAGSSPVEFVFEYKVRRSAASDKVVDKDVYAYLQFGNFDNNLIPRFPAGTPSITGTAAYLNTVPDTLQTVNDADLPGYRFQVIPNGGQRSITNIRLGFTARVNNNGTDEAYIVDDLAVYEVNTGPAQDTEAPTAPAGLASTGKTDTDVSLSWTASTDNVAVTRYDIYQDGILASSVGGATTADTVVGLTPNTAYDFTVKARDGLGNLSDASNGVTVTTDPSANGLPEPFGDRDIGTVAVPGGASYDEETGTFTVQGSGSDIYGTADAFHYVYRPWTGDGQIVARVASIGNSVAWTKAGIMIRGNISAQSPYAMMAVTPLNGVNFQDRLQAGGASTLTAGMRAPAPAWVKLARVGNVISAYESTDGAIWTLVKKETINLPNTVYFGLALTSHENSRLSTAGFDGVTIGEVPPEESNYSPYPGTIDSRKQWLWDKTKAVSEMGGLPLNIAQYVAQILDGQNVAGNLQKLDNMYQTYDWEQYKTVSKMYAYLMVGDLFSSTMLEHVKWYFSQYAYTKLSQTENLRMSNYTAGYLVGQYFPDLVDLNGNSGAALKSMNRANIEEMIEAAVHEGWAEYESAEYTFMTYFCLNAIYQYTDEPDLKQKVKMAMDVMWFEWANDWTDGNIISTTSRAKGDSVTANGPSWRGADHTALSWAYFGQHRAQQGIGDSDAMVPAAYRPYLEYLGMVVYRGMDYTPPEMALRIGQSTHKDYSSRKTNLQNSSGNNLKTYRQALVKPDWGLSTEVTYNRVDNWIEDLPMVLRWKSDSPASVFRVNADQGDLPIGNYDQPANHRVMQDGKAAVGVYKLLNSPTMNYVNAMFPDTGSIKSRQEQSGWIFSDTGPMYFAFKMVKPYSWYYQTPTDPANKVKTTARLHPTNQLSYSYNILRSQADTNGWIIQTADVSEYADLNSFKNAVLSNTTVDATHINDANPRLIYTSLSGDAMDITFDQGAAAYTGTHKINNTPIDYASFKLFDTPWLQQDQNSDIFTASQGGEVWTYNFANWTTTKTGVPVAVPNNSFENGAASPDNWTAGTLSGTPVLTKDTVTSRTYGSSVKISSANAADNGSWSLSGSNMINVDPGAAYTLRAWAKTDSVNQTDGATADITYYKSDGTTVTGSTYSSSSLRGTSSWTQIVVTAAAPADAARISLGLSLKGTGTVWFDDAELITQANIPVTGITLNKETLSMGSGTSTNLTALFAPADASNQTVSWSSDNPAVATVDPTGKVSAIAPGTAVITAVTADGGFTAASIVTVTLQPLYEDVFAGGLGNWDLFGTTAWQVQNGELSGTTTAGSPQRAVVKSSVLPYSSQNYSLNYKAKGDRYRTMFRYTSGTSYYFLEFKNTKEVEMWKYPNSSTPAQVGALVDISAAIPGFDLNVWHDYTLEVDGNVFNLLIDGALAAAFTDSDVTLGGVGFSIKSVGPAVTVNIDDVKVNPIS